MDILNLFILSAGLGERLRPITDHIPKPLLPIIGRPALQYILERVQVLPFKRIGINLHYMADEIMVWLRNSPFNKDMVTFYEEKPLGTGGALKNAKDLLMEGNFLVHNSDIISDIDLNSLVEDHISSGNLATLAVHNHPDFNNLVVDGDGNLIGLKGQVSRHNSMLAFTGIAVYSPEFLGFLPDGVSSVVDGWLNAISKGFRIGTLDFSGHKWHDIGTPVSYAKTVFQMLKDDGERFYIHPLSIGCEGAKLNGYVVIENNCVIGKGASLKDCIVLPGTSVKEGAIFEHTIICDDCVVDVSEPYDSSDKVLIGVGGSDRRYYRIKKGGISRVLMYDNNMEDFMRHIEYTNLFKRYSIPVPEIIDIDYKGMIIVFEDLGDVTLYDWLQCRREEGEIEEAYRKVIDVLIILHTVVTRDISECPLLKERVFDYEYFRWESDYFIERFVKGIRGISLVDNDTIKKELDLLAYRADSFPKTVMHRDLQSQNIMFTEKGPYIIDYQGARIGPPAYDVVSLLWDPYYTLQEEMRQGLLRYYIERMKEADGGFDEVGFLKSLIICRLQRHMQALGAYGFLSKEKGKRHFLKFIPSGLRLLKDDIIMVKDDYKGLFNLVMLL